MGNFFEKIMGKGVEQQEKDPVVQAREALEEYLRMLEEKTAEDVDEKEKQYIIGRETSVLSFETVEEIKDYVSGLIDDLNQRDLKRTMAFMSAREHNLYNYYMVEDYFEKATRALAEYINSGLENGDIKIEDIATATQELKADDKMLKSHGANVEEEDEVVGENLTLYLIPSGKIAIKRENGDIEIEDRTNNKWEVFFMKK